MSSKFTEQETESYYDAEDAIYRSFWDEDGSVHWGVFDEGTGDDFLKACANLNDMMVAKGRIDNEAKVLDLGCGGGTDSLIAAAKAGPVGRLYLVDVVVCKPVPDAGKEIVDLWTA